MTAATAVADSVVGLRACVVGRAGVESCGIDVKILGLNFELANKEMSLLSAN